MGYMTDGLTFNTLRNGNAQRVSLFKTPDGKMAHNKKDGSDWSLLEWGAAVSGELGELNNIVKKVKRGDFTLDEARAEIAREMADVIIYLDLMAAQARIDLGQAVMATFNHKSAQLNLPVYIDHNDWSKTDKYKKPLGGNHNTQAAHALDKIQ